MLSFQVGSFINAWGPVVAEASGVGIGIWLVPCWYIPHYALQQVLTSIELGYDRRTAMAWAVMLVLGKLANMLILLMRLA